jgi:hypothetical protein
MSNTSVTTLLMTSVLASYAVASPQCHEPIETWQPREHLQRQLEEKGWQVNRIKVDDGCYEVKGVDKLGHKFEATYTPASLQIRQLEIEFMTPNGDAETYLDGKAP